MPTKKGEQRKAMASDYGRGNPRNQALYMLREKALADPMEAYKEGQVREERESAVREIRETAPKSVGEGVAEASKEALTGLISETLPELVGKLVQQIGT